MTETVIVSALDDDHKVIEAAIRQAAELLKNDQLVAFPTETVYGLGANALRPQAVQKIFEAKGRPSHNPLIVHVADIEQARPLVKEWPQRAYDLAQAFWPGPLTLVLKKSNLIPDIVSAGGDTVALRVPAHPVALAVIKACGFPLAAPSANRSNFISPTTAEHVRKSLGSAVPFILDGGPCEGGIESTVLNLTSESPTILRPGILSANFLSQILGEEVLKHEARESTAGSTYLSPGQLPTHYSPHTPLYLSSTANLLADAESLIKGGKKVGLLSFEPHPNVSVGIQITMPRDAEAYARQLYSNFHELDAQQLNAIVCELPPDGPEWAGIQDRLSRAGRRL